MSENYGVPAKYFNLLGRSELRSGRVIVAFIAMTIVMAVVIGTLVSMLREQQKTIRELQHQRVMYGFPNAEGLFISEQQIPERHIRAFVASFLDNFYNFAPESAYTNANEALRYMSPTFRALQEEGLKAVAKQSYEQQITQVFVKTTPYKIEVDPAKGYIVTFNASRYRATWNTVFDKKQYSVKLTIKPIKPSKHYEWAVVADDLQTQEIVR